MKTPHSAVHVTGGCSPITSRTQEARQTKSCSCCFLCNGHFTSLADKAPMSGSSRETENRGTSSPGTQEFTSFKVLLSAVPHGDFCSKSFKYLQHGDTTAAATTSDMIPDGPFERAYSTVRHPPRPLAPLSSQVLLPLHLLWRRRT